MSKNTTILDSFMSLVGIWAEKYQKEPEAIISSLVRCSVPVKICNEIYNGLVKTGDLKPLELLTTDEKQLFLTYQQAAENKIENFMAIHTIDFLSKNI